MKLTSPEKLGWFSPSASSQVASSAPDNAIPKTSMLKYSFKQENQQPTHLPPTFPEGAILIYRGNVLADRNVPTDEHEFEMNSKSIRVSADQLIGIFRKKKTIEANRLTQNCC
jgi:hypothetical protein